MKYIEVTGWGNKSNHLIPLNQIVDFNFKETYTTISLSNGKTVNIIETESTIKELLKYHQVNLVSEEDIRTFYEGMAEFQSDRTLPYDDELPF
jgi:hypothetical protein